MKALIAIVAAILALAPQISHRSVSAADSPEKSESSSLSRLIAETDPELQKSRALSYMLDKSWSKDAGGSGDREILSLLRNPSVGYFQGRKLAAILAGASYGLPIERRLTSPIIDKSTDLRQYWQGRPALHDVLGAISYERNLCCQQDQYWKDVLFVYWGDKVHEIPNNRVWGISFLEQRYFLIKVFTVGDFPTKNLWDPNLEDGLALWILDSKTNVLSHALHLTLGKGAAQRSEHTELYGVNVKEVGDDFQPVNAYYREDTGERTMEDSQVFGGSYKPNSPYFIYESFELDRSSMVYKQMKREKVEGMNYLRTISALSSSQGKIKRRGGEVDISFLFKDFRAYSKNGEELLRKAIPLLKPVAQDAIAEVLSSKSPNKALQPTR